MPLQKPYFIQRDKKTVSYQIKTDNLVYIDDYAHHPKINAVYQAVRELYPDKSSCLVSASFIQQNKDFADDFAKSLSQFDELCC
jgi:UDP-N-acetylmuramate--alanine ligase